MIETYFRPAYQKMFVNPFAKLLAGYVSPNLATYFSGLFGLIVFPALYFGHEFIAFIALLISGYFDTMDGTLARLTNRTSDFGSVLDIVTDRIVEISVIAGLFSVAPASRAWLSMGMLASVLFCVTTFLVVGIFAENNTNKGFHYSPGLMERPEAFIFFFFMILFPKAYAILAGVFIILVIWTGLYRVFEFRSQCLSNDSTR